MMASWIGWSIKLTVLCCFFSYDIQAVGLGDGGNRLSVVDANTWQCNKYGRNLPGDLLACCFVPGSRRVLVGSRNGGIFGVDLISR